MSIRRFLPGLVTVYALLVITCVLWFRFDAPPTAPSYEFPVDLMFYYYPMTEQAAARLASGEIPLWDPYSCCGIPLLATAQVGVFYPATWLAVLLPTETAIQIRLFAEVLLSGVFACYFYRSLGAGAVPAMMGGALFLFACALGQVFWTPQVSAIAWMPFLFLASERFLSSGRWTWWLAFIVGLVLQLLAGFPQFVLYTAYLLVPYVVVRLVIVRRTRGCTRRQLFERLAGLMLGAGIALGVAAVQLLPTLELARNSARGMSLNPQAVHYLDLMRGKLLRPSGLLHNAFDTRPKLITFDFPDGAGYLGIATLGMILLGVINDRRNPLVWFFLLASSVFVCLAFGYSTHWSAKLYWLYSMLPTGRLFRMPSRLMLPALFSAISLGVLGMESIERTIREARRVDVAASVLALVGLVVATAFLSTGIGLAAVVTFVLLLGAWRFAVRLPHARLIGQSCILLLVLAEVWHATGECAPLSAFPVAWAKSFHWLGFTLVSAEADQVMHHRAGLDRVALVAMRPTKPIPPLSQRYMLSGYEPLVPERWTIANRVLGGVEGGTLMVVHPAACPAIYALSSVRYITVPNASREYLDRRSLSDIGFHTDAPPPAPPEIRVLHYENPRALPRAYMVGQFAICTPEEALAHIRSLDFDEQNQVLLERTPGIEPSPPGTTREPVEIVSYAPERVSLKCVAGGERLLVLTDTWFPGWAATVDGAPTEILRANYLFRAVRVPPGRHEVVFEYRPASFRRGVAISIGSVLLLVVACAILRRRERRLPGNEGIKP